MTSAGILFGAACGFFALAACASAEDGRTLSFEGRRWEVPSGTASVTSFKGREALFLKRADAVAQGLTMGDGVLEYDFASREPSGFVGVNWRMADLDNSEQFYVRLQQSGRPDATQYMPVFNGVGAWQIHAGPNDATAVELPAGVWTHVKIVAVGARADIYVGGAETPTLHVPHLRRTPRTGGIGLFASHLPELEAGAYFSNISVRPLAPGEGIVGVPAKEPPPPKGLIPAWRVSTPFDEGLVAGRPRLAAAKLPALSWSVLDVENNGVANLAKAAARGPKTNTVLVRTTVTSDKKTVRMLAFGYSDRVRLYLNGELLFAGSAGWRTRDHRFLGTIGTHDSVPLRLARGRNELVAAVSETFGGWGFTGAIEDRAGLTVAP